MVAFLLHATHPGEPAYRIPLKRLPWRVGRGPGVDFIVPSHRVSKQHAAIERLEDEPMTEHGPPPFVVHDLDSRNGTFVNGVRVLAPRRLAAGDVIHISSSEFTFCYELIEDEEMSDSTIVTDVEAHTELLRANRDLLHILSERAVEMVYQPIFHIDGETVRGYEPLGRTALPDGSYQPAHLFSLASGQGRAGELSQMMREVALSEVRRLPARDGWIFFNVHPDEMALPTFLDSLAEMRQHLRADQRPLIEVHEAAVTEVHQMRYLRDRLREMDVGLVYDDFGAGRSRLAELSEVPPDVIKLDRILVAGLDQNEARQGLVRALVTVMQDLGIDVLAEGVETQAELDVCRSLGCTLAQGFLLQRPRALSDLPPGGE